MISWKNKRFNHKIDFKCEVDIEEVIVKEHVRSLLFVHFLFIRNSLVAMSLQ